MKDICTFICTFKQRSFFADHFAFYHLKSGIELPLYIFSDEERRLDTEGVKHIRDNHSTAEGNLGQTPLWGHRLKNALSFLMENYKYAIFSADDGFFFDMDIPRFKDIFAKFKKHDADYYSLMHNFVKEGVGHNKIDDDFLLMDYADLPHYLTHQTSLWKLESLNKLVDLNDTASINEYAGLARMVANNIQLHHYENAPPFDSRGIHHWEAGFDEHCEQRIKDDVQKEIERTQAFSRVGQWHGLHLSYERLQNDLS